MPRIRPESDLRECYEEISTYCRDKKEPIFITKKGHGDLAIMSLEVYELLVQSMDIFRLDRLLQEGKVTEISGALQKINAAEANKSYAKDYVDPKNNVREISNSMQKSHDEEVSQGTDDGGNAREFFFRGSMAQAKPEIPAAVQKIRQDFVKPQE